MNLRNAAVADAERLAALHVETFGETHGGGPSLAVRLQQWAQILARVAPHDFTFVMEGDSGELVAFARGTPHDGGVPGYRGELNKIYVLRRWQRRGLGRLLVSAVATRFREQGIESMLLFGDAGSPSNGFYEHLGAERLISPAGEFHGGYGWRDLSRLLQSNEGSAR